MSPYNPPKNKKRTQANQPKKSRFPTKKTLSGSDQDQQDKRWTMQALFDCYNWVGDTTTVDG